MFLYDWQKIFEKSEGDASVVFTIFKMMVTDQIPKSKYDKIYRFSYINFIGGSFLIHPDVLLYNSYKYSHVEVAQYLALASLRPLSDYFVSGKTSLDLNLVEVDIELFIENSLLRIEDNEVHFLYEEVPQEKKQWH
tara:strand:+ start:259 stop:666 length:408 start_codon:yes stop_codon:yes gene_type:complete